MSAHAPAAPPATRWATNDILDPAIKLEATQAKLSKPKWVFASRNKSSWLAFCLACSVRSCTPFLRVT